ncbi:MAG: type II toxin-antitoxin system HicB family antitoxin [Terracidiphilus sp.]|jgi:predicted RNase H-like HicB family nuclease
METQFEVDFELEEDGRWVAAIERLPGVLAYGSTREEARAKVEALAQMVVQEQAQG